MTAGFILRHLTWTDLAVALWVAFCVGLGVAIGHQVRQLDRYGVTIDQSAIALEETARALRTIAGIPFIGGEVREIAREVAATAARVRQSADDTRSASHDLSILLALAVGVIPTAPLLAFYLPSRVRQVRAGVSPPSRHAGESAAVGRGEPGSDGFAARGLQPGARSRTWDEEGGH